VDQAEAADPFADPVLAVLTGDHHEAGLGAGDVAGEAVAGGSGRHETVSH
jgi:hypothetical protein